MSENANSSPSTNKDSKVDRVIAKYELEGIADELEELWTSDEDQLSIRELTDHFNKGVLRAALRESEIGSFDTEIELIHNVITSDEVDPGEEIEVQERLAKAGPDIDSLSADFVSHQTIYNYLTGTRDVEYERNVDPEDRLRRSNESVQKLKNRLTAMAESNVSSLKQSGLVTVGEFDVVSEVHVYCQDCGGRFTVAELVDERGCRCDQ